MPRMTISESIEADMTRYIANGASKEEAARMVRQNGLSNQPLPKNRVLWLTVERRNALLAKSLELGDKVRRDRRNPNVWLVSSATHPNVWYRATECSCGCKGYQHYGVCRHMVRVSFELHQLRKKGGRDETAVETA